MAQWISTLFPPDPPRFKARWRGKPILTDGLAWWDCLVRANPAAGYTFYTVSDNATTTTVAGDYVTGTGWVDWTPEDFTP